MTNQVITVANVTDSASKKILAKLLAGGFNKAMVQYMTDQSIVPLPEFSHLLKNGFVHSYGADKFGPRAGKDVGFTLKVDLV